MTEQQVLKLLRDECAKVGTQKAWAKVAGVSAAYVSDILSGQRDPAGRVLAALGIEKVVSYRRKAMSDEITTASDAATDAITLLDTEIDLAYLFGVAGLTLGAMRSARDEINRLRRIITTIETLANQGRDDAIDNRGHVIDLTEADQFEAIAVLARSALGDE